MKYIYILLLLLTFVISSCKAQNAPLYRIDRDNPEGTHFKDLDNNLSDFVGTWRWQSNDSIVTITFQKWEDIFFEDTNQYEDMLVGAYKFAVNGLVIQDYLAQLNDNSIYIYEHNIAGNTILHKGQYPKCDDCDINQRRVSVYFTDPLYEYLNSAMVLRHKIEDEVEKIDVIFYSFSGSVIPNIDSPSDNRIPYGNYTFTKQ